MKKYFSAVFLLVFSVSAALNIFLAVTVFGKSLIVEQSSVSAPAFYQQRQLAFNPLPSRNPPTEQPPQAPSEQQKPADNCSAGNLSEIKSLFSAHFCTATDFVVFAIKFLFSIIAILSILFIVIGGFQYITSAGGDDKKVGAAKKTLTNAIVGLAIALMAYSIVTIIANTLGNNSSSGVVNPRGGSTGDGGGDRRSGTDGGGGSGKPARCVSPSQCPVAVTIAEQQVRLGDKFSLMPTFLGDLNSYGGSYQVVVYYRNRSGQLVSAGSFEAADIRVLLISTVGMPTGNVRITVEYKQGDKMLGRGGAGINIEP